MPKKEYIHTWKDWKGCQCSCRIRIFAPPSAEYLQKTVVIATDLGTGNSVTNQAEEIGTAICALENINPRDLILIEHYEGTAGIFDETFDLVNLTWNERDKAFKGVNWTHYSKEQTEILIGEKL